MCVHRETGQRGERNWERDGSICSLAIMREAGDNIWALNWYRLTKYPDQEEKAAVLSCSYTMSAPKGSKLHCDYLIHFNTDILTARPLPKPHFQHSVLESSCACVSQLSLQLQRLFLLCNDYVGFILRYNISLNSKMEDYWFHTDAYMK